MVLMLVTDCWLAEPCAKNFRPYRNRPKLMKSESLETLVPGRSLRVEWDLVCDRHMTYDVYRELRPNCRTLANKASDPAAAQEACPGRH